MIRLRNDKWAVRAVLTGCWCALALCGCSDEVATPSDEGAGIKVSAGVARDLFSRVAEGDVTDGTYYLSYPAASDNAYHLADVEFGRDGADPTIGWIQTADNKPLRWTAIGGGATPTFYLDNVSPELSTDATDPMTVLFDDDNPYMAALYDSIKETNDLLWGDKQIGRDAGTINFDLHHCMARIVVQVTVDKTNEQQEGDLDLEGATVQITHINRRPLSFNRYDGTLTLSDEENVYGTLTFAGEGTKWSDHWQDSENVTTYLTHSCILPPQGLAEDENRPRLVITLKNGNSYSGILPHAMEIEQPIGNPTPAALYFLREHILTIRTVITEEPPGLSFMPVQVVEWVDKGHFSLEGHQSGIYTPEEFYKLLEYYEAYNEYQLPRYGRLVTSDDGTTYWQFDFWNFVELDYSEIYRKITADNSKEAGFLFVSNGFTVRVRKGDDVKDVTMDQLYELVTGASTAPF